MATHLKIAKDRPDLVESVLEKLHHDKSRYVQKSVANNLADMLKDNPDYAFNLITKWIDNWGEETRWIVKHSLRTPYRKGNVSAIGIFTKHQL